ncbi:hydroxyacylglutathione hydrolase [Inhella gelatinilytica]|uniref:Hydroxyacylglutathione hydrolase n=1 Tax=Inhella gelatinilytica TaxID=2795030 RepID=A0A931IX07_9BURK|nr:hydroxyacylglutathione hydrolase [Inhella gelatinilytica]MBH9552570.1 hydroxyacylglutathione hydrolase [Inhella gelatinilytica]
MAPPHPVLSLIPVPALADNYIWLLHDGRNALAVDPGEAAPLRNALQALSLTLRAILVTHHHGDHHGGLADLKADAGADLPVFGPSAEAIAGVTAPVRDGDRLHLLGHPVDVLAVPGHTWGHVAYVVQAQPPVLFCGDTLFGAGCGRLFEGTPAHMLNSLERLASLPPETRVCPAHEYTVANLRFAQAVDPASRAVEARLASALAQRAAGAPTLPSTLALECATNPFLRSRDATVRTAAQLRAPAPAESDEPVAVFTALRQWKNQF